jgi:hypothetical protein
MRHLLAICSAVGLLCGAVGCSTCGYEHAHKVHGRCDCDDGLGYGCHFDMCSHAHGPVSYPVVQPGVPLKPMPKDVSSGEPLKEMPKDVTPKKEEE